MGKGRPVPAMSGAGPPLPGQLPFGASSRSLGPPLRAPSGGSGSYFSGLANPWRPRFCPSDCGWALVASHGNPPLLPARRYPTQEEDSALICDLGFKLGGGGSRERAQTVRCDKSAPPNLECFEHPRTNQFVSFSATQAEGAGSFCD